MKLDSPTCFEQKLVLPKGSVNWLALRLKCLLPVLPPHSPPGFCSFFSGLAPPQLHYFLPLNVIGFFAGRPVIGRPQGVAKLSLSTLEGRQKMLGEAPARGRKGGGRWHLCAVFRMTPSFKWTIPASSASDDTC